MRDKKNPPTPLIALLSSKWFSAIDPSPPHFINLFIPLSSKSQTPNSIAHPRFLHPHPTSY